MKKGLLIIVILGLCILFAGKAFAQSDFATQTVNLAVQAVCRFSVSGNNINLTITDGTAGSLALTPVTDASTTYSLTQNFSGAAKITAGVDANVPANTTLEIRLTPNSKGVTLNYVDISTATTALDVVNGITRGADNNCEISYRFSATADAGIVASTPRLVTLTLSN